MKKNFIRFTAVAGILALGISMGASASGTQTATAAKKENKTVTVTGGTSLGGLSTYSLKKTVTVKGGTSLGGLSLYLDSYFKSIEKNEGAAKTELFGEKAEIPENVAIANVSEKLNVRKGPGTEYDIVGYMAPNAYCFIEGEAEDGWVEIISDDVEGFVKSDYLYTDEEGVARAAQLGKIMATVEASSMNLRSEPTTQDDNIIASLSHGEQYEVIEENVVSRDEDAPLWVKVVYNGQEGYVCKSLVDVEYSWTGAVAITPEPTPEPVIEERAEAKEEKKEKKEKKEEEKTEEAEEQEEIVPVSGDVSAIRAALITTAKAHLGLRYSWGGNSLKSGCDCSGFCLAVYRAVGVDTSGFNRCSYDIAVSKKGRDIKRSELKPGDLIFYGSYRSTSGKINHVAMYYGDGKIIHESSSAGKCIISDMDYTTPIKYRNFLGD